MKDSLTEIQTPFDIKAGGAFSYCHIENQHT